MDREQTAIPLTRRDFLRGAGLALSTLFLEACGRRAALRLTATPPPSPTATRSPSPTATKSPVPTATPSPTATPLLPATATPLPPELVADMVLVGGKVITVDPADTIAQAVAVKDGLIQAVGSDGAIRALVGEKTKVIDLGGKAVTPGLIDPHNHLQSWRLL